MIVYIKIVAGVSTGPFDLYSNLDLVTPFATNISSSILIAGKHYVVPNGTTSVTLISLGECDISVEESVNLYTTTTTTTFLYTIDCGNNLYFISGGFYPYVWNINIGAALGWVKLDFEVTNKFTKYIINFDGVDVLNTGYRGDAPSYPYSSGVLDAALATYGAAPELVVGEGIGSAWFYKSTSTELLYLNVYAPIGDTIAGVRINCSVLAEPTTTTTSSSSTTTSTSTSTTSTTSSTSTTTTTTTFVPLSEAYFYNGYAVNDSRNIAPVEWHVATETDGYDLIVATTTSGIIDLGSGNYASTTSFIHIAINSSSFWDYISGIDNSSNFTAKGLGSRTSTGSYSGTKGTGHIWTSSILSATENRVLYIENGFEENVVQTSSASISYIKFGHSVRFVKDDGIFVPYVTGNDGKVYECVQIGSKIWTKQSVAETKFRNGDNINLIAYADNAGWAADTLGAYTTM